MFSTTGLFKNLACPEGGACTIINCIFAHDLGSKTSAQPVTASEIGTTAGAAIKTDDEPSAKRRRIDHVPRESAPAQQQQQQQQQATHQVPKARQDVSTAPVPSRPASLKAVSSQQPKQVLPPKTLSKPVTPPPPRQASAPNGGVAKPVTKPVTSTRVAGKQETLNPRMIPYDSAGHAKRALLLRHLHDQMKRLNDEVTKGQHPDKKALTLSDAELIKAALDEEEKLARENSNVYANVIKNRIASYKKMKVDAWVEHVIATFAQDEGKPAAGAETKAPPPIVTGLPLDQEHLVLDHLITDQAPLAAYGYVLAPPTDDEIAEAAAGVQAAQNFEVCDRCKSRFRVFPDRREEDGALTTNGPCVHHWGRAVAPKREKTDAIKGTRDSTFSCCNEPLGSKGCTEKASHVFKVSEAKRLASILPFIRTPENADPAKGPDGKVAKAVTFDCEMGYTVSGLELIRLTAVSWPNATPLVDVLVRPQGTILDLNSRFSGVWPEAYNAAVPYDALASAGTADTPSGPAAPLPIVPSPAAARTLLCSYITPATPLIGHALENDLNAIRLCHPRIIDTVALFPHPRGLPMRFGLKMLSKKYLGRDIQMGGANGHDSLEDAVATGELVRAAVAGRWGGLRKEGWGVEAGVLRVPGGREGAPSSIEQGETRISGSAAGVVAKRARVDVGE